MGLLDRSDKLSLLTNQKYLDNRITRLHNSYCLLKGLVEEGGEGGGGIGEEVDPIFTASPAFSITDTNKTNWNTAFGWGDHASAGYLTTASASSTYVPVAGTSTISGAKTFSSTLTTATIIPNGNNNRTLGQSGTQWQTIFTGNVLGASLFLGTTGTTNMSFGINSGATVIGTWFSDGNLLVQTGGTQTNGGFKFDVNGSSRLNGTTTIGGNLTINGSIFPDADSARNLGSSTARWQVFVSTMFKGVASNGMQFAVNNAASEVFARFHTTSHNFLLQAAGTAGGDTGERLQVQGTTLLNGNVSLGGNITVPTTNTYSIGTSALRLNEVYAQRFFSFVIGTAASTDTLVIRQGSINTIGGFHGTTGNMYLQASGAGPADTGERLQVGGNALIAGNLFVNTGSGTNVITLRDATISKASGSGFQFSSGISVPSFANATNNGSSFFFQNLTAGTMTQSSGLVYLHGTYNTINQTGTAGYKGIYMSLHEQTLGSGAKDLVDIGVNSAASNGGTHTSRFRLSSTGLLYVTPPTYADNSAATSGGLVTGNVYKTATGELRIVI